MAVKNAVLLGLRQARKQWQHLGIAKQRLVRQVFAQVIRCLTNLAFAGQKNQDVTGAVRVAPELVHPISNRVVEVVVTRLFKRPVALLHRKHAARHQNHRRRPLAGGKVVRKTLRINRRRGDHHLQIRPARQQLAQIAQQKVNVQAAFMRLVNDDGVVGVELRIGLRLGQQNAIGHQLD